MTAQIINQTLPQEYKPYPEIIFCGNNLKNLKYLIDDNGFIPFLISRGEIPRLWIYTIKDNNAIVAIKDSVATLPLLKVNIFSRDKRLTVDMVQVSNTDDIKIFEIDYSSDVPIVSHIDLRPMGYNIYGDKTSLNIGVAKIENSTFENINSLVKIQKNNNR